MSKLGFVKHGQYVNPKKVPFQEILPLKLKQSVSGKSSKSTGATCVQEMSVLFSCLKKNNFNEKPCSKEVSTFQKCWSENVVQQRMKIQHERQGLLTPGEKQLSHKQVAELLKKFPN